jgi:hypothetical protein
MISYGANSEHDRTWQSEIFAELEECICKVCRAPEDVRGEDGAPIPHVTQQPTRRPTPATSVKVGGTSPSRRRLR